MSRRKTSIQRMAEWYSLIHRPTGVEMPLDVRSRILSDIQSDVIVIVDEAYADFGDIVRWS